MFRKMSQQKSSPLPSSALPRLVFAPDPAWAVPTPDECSALWDRYAMPPHIRAHSQLVAGFALALAQRAHELGAHVDLPSVLAAGLLHDLGKFYSIQHGGSHAQVGGAWVLAETRNPHIAQGVIQHVRWAWDVNEHEDNWLLCLCLIYADKRVMHDGVVGTEERFTDLLERYGHTEEARKRIAVAHEQGLTIEAALSRRLRIDLHEHTFDSGRLVQRA